MEEFILIAVVVAITVVGYIRVHRKQSESDNQLREWLKTRDADLFLNRSDTAEPKETDE